MAHGAVRAGRARVEGVEGDHEGRPHVVEGIGRNAVRAGPVPAPNEAHGDVGRTLAPLLLLG